MTFGLYTNIAPGGSLEHICICVPSFAGRFSSGLQHLVLLNSHPEGPDSQQRSLPLTDKMVVHLNVLGPCVGNRVLRELDVSEVVTVDHRGIGHLLLQILK